MVARNKLSRARKWYLIPALVSLSARELIDNYSWDQSRESGWIEYVCPRGKFLRDYNIPLDRDIELPAR